ncbi:MAG: hypothetical protein ACH350_09260 [Parachlamydiaceae bacterium]
MIIYVDKMTDEQRLEKVNLGTRSSESEITSQGHKYTVETFCSHYTIQDRFSVLCELIRNIFTSSMEELLSQLSIITDGYRTIHYYTRVSKDDDECCEDIVNNPRAALHHLKKTSAIDICPCPTCCIDSLTRRQIERDFIASFQEHFPSKETPLTICSIASAKCFGDLRLHAKLTELGYTIHWMLVDQIYANEDERQVVNDFTRFAKKMSPNTEVAFGCDALQVIDDYQDSSDQPDVFLMIGADLEGTFAQDHQTIAAKIEEKIGENSEVLKKPRLLAYLSSSRNDVSIYGQQKR